MTSLTSQHADLRIPRYNTVQLQDRYPGTNILVPHFCFVLLLPPVPPYRQENKLLHIEVIECSIKLLHAIQEASMRHHKVVDPVEVDQLKVGSGRVVVVEVGSGSSG